MLQVSAAMAAHRRFILYRAEPKPGAPGKTNKFPLDWRTGHVAGATDPSIWTDLATAEQAAALWGGDHGVGFVFTEDCGLWFLDIDDCLLPTGQWSPLAQQLCGALAGCAIEVSRSGRGLHVFGSGALPEHRCKNTAAHLELYHRDRFVALTGLGLQGDAATVPRPEVAAWLVSTYFAGSAGATDADDWRTEPVAEWAGPADDDELVQRLLRTPVSAAAAFAGRASFRDLWEGNETALSRAWPDQHRAYDASSADAALAAHLAWATGNNHERMLRLMQRSALAREKWERDDYLRRTIGYSASRTTRWMQDRAVAPAAPAVGGSFAAAAGGAIPPTLVNLQAALRSAESGVRLAYDAFKDRIVLGAGEVWRPFTDADYVTLRTSFEERGFKPIKSDLMRDSVLLVAMGNTIDTARQWAEGLVWDGVPRVDAAMARYYGCQATPYARAVGRYLFAALAGRALDPGCQADMAVILVGPQGNGKTSSVMALAPEPASFGGVSLAKIEDDSTARKLRGKLVIELGELRGLMGRDVETIKEWITRRHEAWVPKYREFETIFDRRCVLIGTANGDDLLSDSTGNRRWLPIRTGVIDLETLRADCLQLWAEGAAIYRAQGSQWQEAQTLAEDVHSGFEQTDEWEHRIAAWLDKTPPAGPGEVPSPTTNGARPFALIDLARDALGVPAERVDQRGSKRIASILRKFNYEKQQTWISGRNLMLWRSRG